MNVIRIIVAVLLIIAGTSAQSYCIDGYAIASGGGEGEAATDTGSARLEAVAPAKAPANTGSTAAKSPAMRITPQLRRTAVPEDPSILRVNQSATFTIQWHSINSGGVMDASSANYQVSQSVGQAVVGEASSAAYTMGIGFWYGATDAVGVDSCSILLDGDVNESGSLSAADIIFLVGFVFKGGPTPRPCQANGDVNCNDAVSAADIIYMVGHVFKSGPPPCDICNDPGAMDCVPNP